MSSVKPGLSPLHPAPTQWALIAHGLRYFWNEKASEQEDLRTVVLGRLRGGQSHRAGDLGARVSSELCHLLTWSARPGWAAPGTQPAQPHRKAQGPQRALPVSSKAQGRRATSREAIKRGEQVALPMPSDLWPPIM